MFARRMLLPWLVASVVLALSLPAFAGLPRSLVATVQHFADGDTLTTLSENGTKLRVRLLGIDATEVARNRKPGQPLARSHATTSITW